MSRPLLAHALPPLVLAAGLTGCSSTPTVEADAFTRVDVEILDGSAAVNERFVAALDATERQALVMLPQLEDTTLSDALIAAQDRGVLVEVVTDYDEADDAGTLALIAAGVPVTLADDSVEYFDFSINNDVSWDSADAIMSHAMLILDETRVVNATMAGDLTGGARLLFDVTSEDLAWDMAAEHNQVFGGTDATTLTAYSSLAKSVTDSNWRYPTQTDLDLEVWLGPQERVVKRVIDAIYSARKSVRVLSNDVADEGLAKALQDKAGAGFDVKVIVGPAFGTSAAGPSSKLANDTPDVVKVQVDDEDLPTLVLVDVEEEGEELLTARAMVVSHDLYSAARLYGSSEIRTDQLIDGNLFVLDDYDEPSDELLSLRTLWQEHFDRGSSL